jgi:hypothetical protein
VTIPSSVIKMVEQEANGITHGEVILKIALHDGHDTRYTISREVSIIPGRATSGDVHGGKQ